MELGSELTSNMAGTGIMKSKYRVALGLRNISSSIIAFTAPLAPFITKQTDKIN